MSAGERDATSPAQRGRPGLAPEQAERVRAALASAVRDRYDGNISALARDLGLSQSGASQLISGRNDPSFATAQKLAELTGVPVLSLLDGELDSAPADANGAVPDAMALGELVRTRREALGWTQGDLAERAGLARVDVSRVETGYNHGSSHRMRVALAKGFGVEVEELESFLMQAAKETAAGGEPLSPFAERVMLAYRCLPRGKHGRLPSFRSIEQAAKLPPSTFSKLSLGHRTDAMAVHTMTKLAAALGVSTGWLATGEGRGPETTADGEPTEAPDPRQLCALPGWEHALAGAVRLAPSLPAGLLSAAGECAIVAPSGAHVEPTPEIVASIAAALAVKGAAR